MIRRIFHIAPLLCIILVRLNSQQPLTADDIVSNVQKKYSSLNDASAHFLQTTQLRFGKNSSRQSGVVKIKKGNKYKIILPAQTIMTNGKLVWIYSSSDRQVVVDSVKESHSLLSPDKFLQGFPSDYTVSSFHDEGGIIKVDLVPSAKNRRGVAFSSLLMWINRKDWLVTQIEYTDRNKTKNSIRLSGISINQGIDDSEFTFVPDSTMTVIDARTLR